MYAILKLLYLLHLIFVCLFKNVFHCISMLAHCHEVVTTQ
jgi:hypothetical protein